MIYHKGRGRALRARQDRGPGELPPRPRLGGGTATGTLGTGMGYYLQGCGNMSQSRKAPELQKRIQLVCSWSRSGCSGRFAPFDRGGIGRLSYVRSRSAPCSRWERGLSPGGIVERLPRMGPGWQTWLAMYSLTTVFILALLLLSYCFLYIFTMPKPICQAS